MRVLLHGIGDAAGRNADRRAAERGDEALDRHRSEADAQALHVVHGAHRLVRGEQVARLSGQKIEDLQALVFRLEQLKHVGIVERLGADLRAAGHVGQLDDLGERETARSGAGQVPGDVGDPGARIVDIVLHRSHFVGREDGDVQPAVGPLLQLVDPVLQVLGKDVLGIDEVAELEIVDRIAARHGRRGNQCRAGEQRRVELPPVHEFLPLNAASSKLASLGPI